MMETILTVTTLTAIASVLLSFGLEYVPKVDVWYALRTIKEKKQIMGLLIVLSAIGAYLAGCYTPYIVVACTQTGFWEVIQVLIAAIVLGGVPASQSMHKLTKKS